MQLRKYQQDVIDKVVYHIETNQRCCVSLATGGGKTVIFSELVNNLEGRTLICVHREELVTQTSNTLKREHDILVPKTKGVSKDLCVAMVQTLFQRVKKELIDINSYDNLIIDECHRGEFMNILNMFNGKVIGLTATPNYEKKRYFHLCLICGTEYESSCKCCGKKTQKFKENTPLSTYYHTLIEGVEIGELIEQGFLVPEEQFILKNDTSFLVYDEKIGDYTEQSISLVFGSPEAIRNTIKTYKEIAFGLKTIIFNPNTLVNKLLFDAMISDGIKNVKMYDSNNQAENRHDLVEWFRNTPDAILLNVQVFTTGFDCTDVQVVFLNKKTQSINSYLQMVGRGGRITDKIFKPSFKVIDMGNNDEGFDKWSAKRSWNEYFYNKELKEVGAPQPASTRVCHSCESLIAGNSLSCEVCGAIRVYTGSGVKGLPTLNGKPVIPSPLQIVQYCEKNELTTLEARKIVYKYASEMFLNVKFETFRKANASGELYERALNKFSPYYFAIQDSKMEGNRVRTRQSFINEIIKEIERGYSTGKNL